MFSHLLCNNVNIQKITGYDDYDSPIIDEIITVKGKLEFQINKVINKNGVEVISSGQLRLKERLSELDRIDVNGVWREIINIVPQDDFSGKNQYYIVYF